MTSKATKKKSAPKEPATVTSVQPEAVKAPVIKIEKMTESAHIEVGDGMVTVYPDLPSEVSIVNDRRGSIPTNVIVESKSHSMLLIPNPNNPDVSLSTPLYFPPGRHILERCSIKNRGAMVQRLKADTPLFDVIFIPACNAGLHVIEFEDDPKEAA